MLPRTLHVGAAAGRGCSEPAGGGCSAAGASRASRASDGTRVRARANGVMSHAGGACQQPPAGAAPDARFTLIADLDGTLLPKSDAGGTVSPFSAGPAARAACPDAGAGRVACLRLRLRARVARPAGIRGAAAGRAGLLRGRISPQPCWPSRNALGCPPAAASSHCAVPQYDHEYDLSVAIAHLPGQLLLLSITASPSPAPPQSLAFSISRVLLSQESPALRSRRARGSGGPPVQGLRPSKTPRLH